MPRIKFIPSGKELDLDAGTNLLEAADQAGLYVEGDCAGKGTCGKCRVKIIEGDLEEPTDAELKHLSEGELKQGWALACQREIKGDCVVEIPLQKDSHSRKTSLKGGVEKYESEPVVEKIAVELTRPKVGDQIADLERLAKTLDRPDLVVKPRELAHLPTLLRKNKFQITAALSGNRVLALEAGDTTNDLYGVAFDIGTTTIVGSMLNLNNAEVVAVSAATNPQNIYGADVISRINHVTAVKNGLKQLQDRVIGAINEIILNLVRQTGVAPERIYEVVAVGNTTMSHLFMGVDPTYLAPAPFIPVYSRALDVEAAALKIKINPAARVIFLPNIAGYVGSDTVGAILAADLDLPGDNCAIVDIGTNGELVLRAHNKLIACSTAAGPAFEGAEIKQGMRAAAGAIEIVTYEDGRIKLGVIDDAPACGICGSGLIDSASALLDAGLVEPSGRFIDPQENQDKVPAELLQGLRKGKGGYEYVLVPKEDSGTGEDIILTQGDLRELQLAKGAINAGLMILLKEAGISPGELDRVLLAGAFGNYVRKESALGIGLLPQLPPEKITAIGNAAGDGAKMALASASARHRAAGFSETVEYIELSTRLDFQEIFVEALPFR